MPGVTVRSVAVHSGQPEGSKVSGQRTTGGCSGAGCHTSRPRQFRPTTQRSNGWRMVTSSHARCRAARWKVPVKRERVRIQQG